MTRVISLIGLLGLLVIAAMIVGEVLLRWLFRVSVPGIADVSTLVVTVAIASCFPLLFAERKNVTVRMVGILGGPRLYATLEAFGSLIALAIFFLLVWKLWEYTGKVATNRETTLVSGLSTAPWYGAATAMMILCIPVQIFIFYRQVKSAISRKGGPDQESGVSKADNSKEKES